MRPIASWWRLQPFSVLCSHASLTPSSPSLSWTNEIRLRTDSAMRSWSISHSCFISSHRLRAESRSPASIASIARSIVGRESCSSSSGSNQRSLICLPPRRRRLPRPQAVEQLLDGARHRRVELLDRKHAAVGHDGQALQGGEDGRADALAVAADELAGALRLVDQCEDHRERALRGVLELLRAGAVLGGEHQLDQRGVARGEPEVGERERGETGAEVVAGLVERHAQLATEALEALEGERVEQRLAVGEVAARRGVADAHLAGELAQ